jgi:hypothetical protein
MLVVLLAITAFRQGGASAPVPTRFQISSRSTSEQDLTAVGQGKVAGAIMANGVVTVSLSDSATGQIAKVTVESLTLQPSGAMEKQVTASAAAAAADSARGQFIRAFTVHNALRNTPEPSSHNPALASIQQVMGVLFPGIRSNIKPGDSWADTTNVNSSGAAGKQLGRIISSWKVTGMEAGDLVLDGTSVTHIVTTGQPGQSRTVDGHSTEHLVMTPQGRTRRATIDATSDLTLVTPQAPGPIPGHTTALLTVAPAG